MKPIPSFSRATGILALGLGLVASSAQTTPPENLFGERVLSNGAAPEPVPEPEIPVEPVPEVQAAPKTPSIHPEIEALQKMHASWLETARKPLDTLSSRYKTALEKYRDESQTAGKLKPVLAAKTALEALDAGRQIPASEDPVVGNLQKVYQANLPAAQTATRQASLRADQDYLTFLRKLVEKFTREGKLDLALVAQTEADTVAARVGKGGTAPAGTGGVVILSAIYGRGEKSADVTQVVKKFVEQKKSFVVTPADMGSDPNPYWHKGLTVKYTKDGIEREQRRGENERVLAESFYGPQDAAELEKWLVGTMWKADVRLEFKVANKFHVTGRLNTYSWETSDSPFKIYLVWSPEKKTECTFGYTWESFSEAAEGARVFKKVK